MLLFTRIILIGLVILSFISCKKETVIKNEDNFINQPEQLSALNTEVSAAGYQFVEIQWTAVNHTHFKAVTYTIYLDDLKIVDGLTTTKYSIINLKAGQKYAVKIIAIAKDGKQTEQTLNASTLGGTAGDPSLYREYNIHSDSRITGGTAIKKLADGGHLVVKILQHSDYFDDEIFKIIYFRTDKNGDMLWYRLLSTRTFNASDLSEFRLTSHKADQEGLLFFQNYAIKFATSNGDILLEKKYTDYLQLQAFQSIFYASPQQIIAGTSKGALLSINPEDLSVTWHQANADRLGSILAINVDSKKNIYYIFKEENESNGITNLHMCNAKGEFVKDIVTDATLPDLFTYGFYVTALLVDEQDNIYLFGRKGYNLPRLIKINANGTLLKQNTDADYVHADRAFFNDKGEIVVVGQIDAGGLNTYAAIYVFDKDMNIKSKRFYTEIPSHLLRGITVNPDGSYNIFLNYMQTYTYDNGNFVYIKTDADGQI